MIGRQGPKQAASTVKGLLRRGAAKLGRIGREERGTVVVLAGIIFPAVIGGMGLGAEAGYWYFSQRKLQHAADVSVYAAAIRKSQKDSHSQYEKVALRIAEEAGFNKSAGAIQVNSPPNEPSAYAGNPNAVQVVLDETLPRLFTALFTGESLTLSGRAVALVEQGSPGCVLALSGTASSAMKVSGSAKIHLTACDVASNSVASDSFNMQGGSLLTTGCVHTVGGASATQNLTMTECSEVHEYAPKALDPYADVAEPEIQGNCSNDNFTPQGEYELHPQDVGHPSGLKVYRFCGSVDFKGKVEFKPGLYIFTKPLNGGGGSTVVSANANGGGGTTLSGTNVTFYFGPGFSLNFNGNATINLSARTEDPYAGILFFSARDAVTANHTVNGGASGSFDGAVYFPTGNIKYAGGASAGGKCTQIIGNTVEFTGNSQIGSDCTGKGTRSMAFGQSIAIVE